MQLCNQQAHQNTAEYAGVKRSDAHDHGLAGLHRRRVQNTQTGQQDIHYIVHSEEADHAGQCRDALFLFRIADGDGNSKNDRKIGVDGIAHGLEQIKEQLDIGIAQNRPQCHNVLCRKRRANAHQNACDGQDHDRRH